MARPSRWLDPRYVAARLRERSAPRSLRFHLLFVVGVAFLPLLLFSTVSAVLFAGEERRIFRNGVTDRTLALLTAVDTELKRAVAALEVLAASENLDRGDVARFRAEAGRVLASRPEWLNLHLAPPSGLQVMNLLRPSEGPFHEVIDRGTFDAVARFGRPVVGNLFREPLTGRHVFPVRVPVHREGRLRFVLSALVDPQVIDGLLVPQGLPADWVGVVLDAKQVIVARTIRRELVGKPASDSLRAALADADHGWFQGSTVEGWPVYTPFNRSAFSGWSVALGIPSRGVEASLRRALALLGLLGVVLLGAGFWLAWLLSGGSVRALTRVTEMAQELGRGREPTAATARRRASFDVAEVDALRGAFEEAARLIRARSDERDRVESSLRRAEARLRETEQRKDHFMAMLGHELRNPLGVIATATHLLRESELRGTELEEPRAMIERQVAHMTKMLDDLLDVTRIAEGRVELKRVPQDLVAIVGETVQDHRALLEQGGLELDLQLPDRPMWVMGDATRLSQSVGNVLQNAGKYTNPGGRIRIRLEEESGGEWATLAIRDTGVGMGSDILMHAFDPFSQADRTIDRSRGGLGLGLALVKGLVELHGGEVSATSGGLGRGSEICIRLPLTRSLERPGEAAGEYDAKERPRRVLVIEDNRMAARSIELYLTRRGHSVEVAHTGVAGLEAVSRYGPDVVLCDIGLPGMDGYEVAHGIRGSRSSEILLVAVSGYGQAEDRRRSFEAGFDVHMTKPLDLAELRSILAAGVEGGGARSRE